MYSKSSVPVTDIDELCGIVFTISNASPMALFLLRFTKIMSSSDADAARNPTAEPTRPTPIIEIISIHTT
jgi:hypothetical protein